MGMTDAITRALTSRSARRREGAVAERGLGERGSGATGSWPVIGKLRSTSLQACGLWPLGVSPQAVMRGVPLGVVTDGPGVVCADPMTWFTSGLISAPTAMVLGLNGLGKSSLLKRTVIGHDHMGIRTLVLGDLKPDYVRLIEALGGQRISIGAGKDGINPLDVGDIEGAVAMLGRRRDLAEQLVKSAHSRRMTMVTSLVQITRGAAPTQEEELILDEAVTILEERGGRSALADLIDVVVAGGERLRASIEASSDRQWEAGSRQLVISLRAAARGTMGAVFGAERTTPMLLDRSAVLDVSALRHEGDAVKAAALLSCWAYGFGMIEIAHALADAGVAERPRFNVVMDELGLVLGSARGMAERVDMATRLNRSLGVGLTMATHSMRDFDSLTREDRIKALGFVERSKILFLAGLPPRELEVLRGVFEFSRAEEELLGSWAASATMSALGAADAEPAGLGCFLLKTSAAPGIPFQVELTSQERVLIDTNERWEDHVSHRGAA